ncbi:hypothetical protein LA080_001831 [Diaporthe eres]|nr:hypothetical protein LA080_001831 [Diaporthe eres]
MQFSSALAVILGLAGASKALDGDGAYVGDFSMWNGESCYGFKNSDEQSVRSVHLKALGEGYTLTVYTSEDRSKGADIVPIGECLSSEEGYVSFIVSTGN